MSDDDARRARTHTGTRRLQSFEFSRGPSVEPNGLDRRGRTSTPFLQLRVYRTCCQDLQSNGMKLDITETLERDRYH